MLEKLKSLFTKKRKELKQKAKEVYTLAVDKLQNSKDWIKTYPTIKLNQVDWVTPNTDLRSKLKEKGITPPAKKCLRLETQNESLERVFRVISSDGSFSEVTVTTWYKWADPAAVEKDRQELERMLAQ